jgi:hypothetical protein
VSWLCSRPGGRAAFLAAGVAVAAGLAGAAFAITPPTGDQAAITFFKQEADAYASIPGAKIVTTGYFSMRFNGGTSVSYSWGAPPPAGYRPATVTVVERLKGGKISAYIATVTAPKMPRLRILLADGKVYDSVGSCWNRSHASSSPYGTGERFLFNNGGAKFQPLAPGAAGSTTSTYSYSWVPGAPATQTDTFSGGTPPTVTTRIAVSGRMKLSIHTTITPLRTAPPLPVVPAPGGPTPKPLCASR